MVIMTFPTAIDDMIVFQAQDEGRTPDPDIEDIVDQIMRLSGKSKKRVAEDLLGITRQSVYLWSSGGISPANLAHLLKIRSILEIAHQTLKADGEGNVGLWLETPRLEENVTPQELLRAKQYDKARLLAMTANTLAVTAPKSLSGLPLDSESERMRKILDHVSNLD